MSSSYGQFIVVLLIFVGVLALTFFVTRWVSGYQKGRGSGSNIQLIESAPLTSNKHIQILRIGEKYLAVAVSKDNVTLLTELDEDELKTTSYSYTGGKTSFKDFFSKTKAFNIDNDDDDENE